MSDFPLSGRLEDRSFAVLAGRVFREGRSGELLLESGERSRRVWFMGGNPVAVVSDDPHDHVAQVLLQHGKIDADAADRLASLPETREGLGAAEFIPRDILNWGVKFRFVNLCYDLFRWEEGDYSFTEATPPRELLLLKIPAHALVFKGVGYMPRHVVAEVLPDDALLAAGDLPASDAPWLGEEERALLEACRPGRTVGGALAAAGGDPAARRPLLYALLCLGLASLTPPVAAPEPPAEDDAFDLPAPGPEPPGIEPIGMEESEEEPPPLPEFSLGEEAAAAEPDLNMGHPAFDNAGRDFTHGESAGGGFGFGDFPADDGPAGAPTEPHEPEQEEEAPRRFSFGSVPRAAYLGGAAIVLLVAVGAWLWLGSGSQPPLELPPVARDASTPAPPVEPVPMPAVPAPEPPAAPQVDSVPSPPTSVMPALPEPAQAVSPEPPAVPTPPASAEPPAAAAPKAAPAAEPVAGPARGDLPSQPLSARYRSGLEVFKAGDHDAAAAVWESLLAEEHTRDFTVLAATLCERDSIRTLVGSFAERAPAFLVTRQVQGRSCFRVCFGTFANRAAAMKAMEAMPAELRASGAAVRSVAEVLGRGR